jgi:phosphatidate cytidylyltransferase
VWAVIAPVYGIALLAGELTVLILVLFLVFQGMREYASLVGLPNSYRRILVLAGLAAPVIALISLDAFLFLPPVILILATLQPLFLRNEREGVKNLAFAALGWGYIAWFLTHFILLYKYVDGGPGVLLAIGLAVALSDVGAFTVGTLIGRHKMAPRISPNKTWEGAIGNFVGAFAGIAIMSFALPQGGFFWGFLAVLPVVVALGSIWGDLLESVIKREFEVKDAGAWLSGFGGLLDRIDSLIIVVPLVFYVLMVIVD